MALEIWPRFRLRNGITADSKLLLDLQKLKNYPDSPRIQAIVYIRPDNRFAKSTIMLKVTHYSLISPTSVPPEFNYTLKLGMSNQDILSMLNSPDIVESVCSHQARSVRYEYRSLGVEFYFCQLHHKLYRIILHNNTPGYSHFGQFHRNAFQIRYGLLGCFQEQDGTMNSGSVTVVSRSCSFSPTSSFTDGDPPFGTVAGQPLKSAIDNSSNNPDGNAANNDGSLSSSSHLSASTASLHIVTNQETSSHIPSIAPTSQASPSSLLSPPQQINYDTRWDRDTERRIMSAWCAHEERRQRHGQTTARGGDGYEGGCEGDFARVESVRTQSCGRPFPVTRLVGYPQVHRFTRVVSCYLNRIILDDGVCCCS